MKIKMNTILSYTCYAASATSGLCGIIDAYLYFTEGIPHSFENMQMFALFYIMGRLMGDKII